MPNIMIKGYKCNRCKKEWVSNKNKNKEPIVCPRCKSPYWNKDRLWIKTEEDD